MRVTFVCGQREDSMCSLLTTIVYHKDAMTSSPVRHVHVTYIILTTIARYSYHTRSNHDAPLVDHTTSKEVQHTPALLLTCPLWGPDDSSQTVTCYLSCDKCGRRWTRFYVSHGHQ